MYRVILVDDEPLILAGIASLINWEDYGCTIVGKATNGPSGYEMIMDLKPDIAITDIRMPILNGLELVEKCKSNGCTFSFIVLTNLEEFRLVQKALSLGASDYLVKIDLNTEALSAALARAKESCDLLVRQKQHQHIHSLLNASLADQVRGYISQLLINPSLDAVEPAELRKLYPHPFVILFSLRPAHISYNPEEEAYDFRQAKTQIMDILGGVSQRAFDGYTLIPYNDSTFLLAASIKDPSSFQSSVKSYCSKCNTVLKTYFELTAVYGISTIVSKASKLPDALTEALTALEYYYYDSSENVVFYCGQSYHKSNAKSFNINFLKKDLSASIAQNDSEQLHTIFQQIISLFEECKPSKEHATSACINIYTYLYSLFESEDNSYQDIFPFTINIAEQLGHFNSLADILEWLQSFCQKLCRLLTDRKETRSDKLVEQAKRYVNQHYQEKLSLMDISDALNISYGHLSNTFKKCTGITLSDYIAGVKIEHAKELIDSHQYLMYEISDKLGFENPYYFSKVFKKITGVSPRDYEKRK